MYYSSSGPASLVPRASVPLSTVLELRPAGPTASVPCSSSELFVFTFPHLKWLPRRHSRLILSHNSTRDEVPLSPLRFSLVFVLSLLWET